MQGSEMMATCDRSEGGGAEYPEVGGLSVSETSSPEPSSQTPSSTSDSSGPVLQCPVLDAKTPADSSPLMPPPQPRVPAQRDQSAADLAAEVARDRARTDRLLAAAGMGPYHPDVQSQPQYPPQPNL